MKIASVLISLFFFNIGFTQVLPEYYDTLVHEHELIVKGGIDYSSSAIQKDILSKFYRGGFITNEIKDNSFSRHSAINRAGIDASAEIAYINYKSRIFKNKPWGYIIKAGYNNFGGVLYSKDLFGLAFYGNSMYVGDTINMSGSDLSFTAFQKVGFGFIHEQTKTHVSLNFYNISNRISGDFRTLELAQNSAGDEVSLVMDGDVEMADNLNFLQGFGAGFDVDYKLAIDWGKERTAFIQFQLSNLGFAYLHEKQKTYSFDTTFNFTGLRFNEIIGDNAIISDSLSLLDTLGIVSGTSNRTFLLPGHIQIAKIVDEHQSTKLQSFFGVRLYPTLIYNPYLFAGVDYRPIDNLHIGASMSYGGFAKLKGGLYASYRTGKINLGIGTENIVGFFSKKANGESINIRVGCVI